jgi:hypothetical protein
VTHGAVEGDGGGVSLQTETTGTGGVVSSNVPSDTCTVRIAADGFKMLELKDVAVAVTPGDDRSRPAGEQSVMILRDADEKRVAEIAVTHGVSALTICGWRKPFGSRSRVHARAVCHP